MGISEDDDEAVNKETETNDDKSIKSSGGKFWPMLNNSRRLRVVEQLPKVKSC